MTNKTNPTNPTDPTDPTDPTSAPGTSQSEIAPPLEPATSPQPTPAPQTPLYSAGQQPTEQQVPPQGMNRLMRSRDNRMIAGVCGGLARATNTDPILFRVILAVLVFFGGVGALLYLLGWLLLPVEGETASPLGALLGRGNSATGVVTTIALAGATILMLSWAPGYGFPFNTVLLAALALAGYLLLRRQPGNAGTWTGSATGNS